MARQILGLNEKGWKYDGVAPPSPEQGGAGSRVQILSSRGFQAGKGKALAKPKKSNGTARCGSILDACSSLVRVLVTDFSNVNDIHELAIEVKSMQL